MEIHLTSTIHTSTLKELFSTLFPYLKLEFFHKPHASREGSPIKDMYKADHPIAEVGFNGQPGELAIRPEMKIAEFEKTMYERFGLCVQVFRKSGKIWLETSHTDHLSLSSQNDLGKERERPLEQEPRGEIDLNEQP